MTKKELIKAIKTCKQAYATTKLTENDMFDIQIIKADLLWNIKQYDTKNWTEDHFNAWIDKHNCLRIG